MASGQKNGFRPISSQSQLRALDRVRSHLHERAADGDAGEHLAGDRAGGDPRRGLARRRAPAAAIIAQAVLDVVGVVGVAGAVLVADLGIVLRALVDVLDQERDRRAGRDLLVQALVGEDAGEDPDLVRLAALRREARLPRPALVELGLDLARLERDQRRTAVDDAAERRPMALAEGRDAEQMAEAVVGHGRGLGRKHPTVIPGASDAARLVTPGQGSLTDR